MARSQRRRGGGLLRILNLLPFLPLAGKAPLYARLLWSLATDARVPASRKALLGLAGAYIVSPLDLVPEWIPIVGAIDDVAVMVLAIDVFLEGLPEGLVAEKLVELGIPPSELEDDLARVRRMVPRPVRALVARVPFLLDRVFERINESGVDRQLRAAIEARMPSSEGNAA
ncbi:MAG: YkvA family protein [Chloroflexota bacterium]|nr:YkvA family protein [Chloroflexota bacterium]